MYLRVERKRLRLGPARAHLLERGRVTVTVQECGALQGLRSRTTFQALISAPIDSGSEFLPFVPNADRRRSDDEDAEHALPPKKRAHGVRRLSPVDVVPSL